MTLNEYREQIEAAEAAPLPNDVESLAWMSACLNVEASRIRSSLWQPGYREEAMELAARHTALADRADAALRDMENARYAAWQKSRETSRRLTIKR